MDKFADLPDPPSYTGLRNKARLVPLDRALDLLRRVPVAVLAPGPSPEAADRLIAAIRRHGLGCVMLQGHWADSASEIGLLVPLTRSALRFDEFAAVLTQLAKDEGHAGLLLGDAERLWRLPLPNHRLEGLGPVDAVTAETLAGFYTGLRPAAAAPFTFDGLYWPGSWAIAMAMDALGLLR